MKKYVLNKVFNLFVYNQGCAGRIKPFYCHRSHKFILKLFRTMYECNNILWNTNGYIEMFQCIIRYCVKFHCYYWKFDGFISPIIPFKVCECRSFKWNYNFIKILTLLQTQIGIEKIVHDIFYLDIILSNIVKSTFCNTICTFWNVYKLITNNKLEVVRYLMFYFLHQTHQKSNLKHSN